MSLVRRILEAHLLEGEVETGREAVFRVDETFVTDLSGPLAFLLFETSGVERVRPRTVVYIDHDLDAGATHRFLRTAAARYGAHLSPAGNGICHVVHRERFAVPGALLLGADSRTPTAGAVGTLAFAASRIEVAAAMASGRVTLVVPPVTAVRLKGALRPWAGPRDIAFHLVHRLGARGAHGRLLEFVGSGAERLEIEERAAVANAVLEAGARGALFPADERTRRYLRSVGRARDFRRLGPEAGAAYDETLEVDLRRVEPAAAQPPSTDHVVSIREVEGEPVDQVLVGSCGGGSYADIALFAAALKGRRVHPDVAAAVAPGSRRVLEALARAGLLADLAAAGVRVLESACGPCLGGGLRPSTSKASLRTFPRNQDLRTGVAGARIFLAGPAVAAATAVKGSIADPRRLWAGPPRPSAAPSTRGGDGIVPPPRTGASVEVERGGRFARLPSIEPIGDRFSGVVLFKAGDDLDTASILPDPGAAAGLFAGLDPAFARRAAALKEKETGLIAAGENFGRGSGREETALALAAAGVRAVLARSFARALRANLIRFGIAPLVYEDASDADVMRVDDRLEAVRVRSALRAGDPLVFVRSDGKVLRMRAGLSAREVSVLLAGGLMRAHLEGGA